MQEWFRRKKNHTFCVQKIFQLTLLIVILPGTNLIVNSKIIREYMPLVNKFFTCMRNKTAIFLEIFSNHSLLSSQSFLKKQHEALLYYYMLCLLSPYKY
jgi:hypothetical protein